MKIQKESEQEIYVTGKSQKVLYLDIKHFIGCLASAWKNAATKNLIILSSMASLLVTSIFFRITNWSSVDGEFTKAWISVVLSTENKKHFVV